MGKNKLYLMLGIIFTVCFVAKYLIIDSIISSSLFAIPIFITVLFNDRTLPYKCAIISTCLLLFGNLLFLEGYSTSFDMMIVNSFMMATLFGSISLLVNNIIGRRQSENELLNSKERLEMANSKLTAIISGVEQHIASFDLDLNLIILNESYKNEFLKITNKELKIGDSVLDAIILKRDREKLRSFFKRALNGEQFTVIQKYDNNSKFTYELRFSPLKNCDNQIIGVVQIIKNISEELKNKKVYETQKHQISIAEQFSHVGHWRLVLDNNEMNWSEEVFEIFKLPNTGVLPLQGMYDKIHILDQEYVQNYFQTAIKDKQSFKAEFRIMRFETQIRYVVLEAYVETDEKGNATSIYGVMQDITEIKTTLSQLAASEDRYKSMIASLSEGIIYFNHKGQIVGGNQQAEHILQTKLESLHGFTSIEKYNVIKEDGTPFLMDEFPSQITLKTGKECRNVIMGFYISEKDIKWISVNSQMVTWNMIDEEEPYSVIISFNDITDRIKAEQTIEKRAEALARSNHDLERFAYVVSHDLQEPLRTVTNYCQLLEKRFSDKLDDDGRLFIKYTIDSSKRMKELLNALLELSRVTTKVKPPKTIITKLLIQDIIEDLDASITDANATIKLQKSLPNVYMYDAHASQIFQNLISNALKFKDENRTLTINIGTIEENGILIFFIEDNGIGIDNNQFDRIFEIFARLHSREQYPGAGIGLAICKKVIDFYHGNIWVESEVGKGTKIFFTLPTAKNNKLD